MLFGDGEERVALEQLAKELGVTDHIRFLGFQPHAARYLSSLDCFVLPSLSEGLPFALMEALAVGLPVVVTAVGGMAELLHDEDDGLLVPAANSAALAAGIGRVLRDDDLAKRLREGARRTSGRFSLQGHVHKLRKLYDEALVRTA